MLFVLNVDANIICALLQQNWKQRFKIH